MLKFLIIVIAAALFAGYAYEQFDLTFGEANHPDTKFCPKDRFQCSDGLYIERTGPNCEFICP